MNPRERKTDSTLQLFGEVIEADAVSLKVRTVTQVESGPPVPAYLPYRCWPAPGSSARPGEPAWVSVAGAESIKWIPHESGLELLVARTNVAAACEVLVDAVTNLRGELAKEENSAMRDLVTHVSVEVRVRDDDAVRRAKVTSFEFAGEPPAGRDIAAAVRQHVH